MNSDHFLTKKKKCCTKEAKSTSLFSRTKISAFNLLYLVTRMNQYRLKVDTWYSFRHQHT